MLGAAISENLGAGSREQVGELYLQIVEPFFGLKLRQDEVDALRNARAAHDASAPSSVDGAAGNGSVATAARALVGAKGKGRARSREPSSRAGTVGLNGEGEADTKSESSEQADEGKDDADGE